MSIVPDTATAESPNSLDSILNTANDTAKPTARCTLCRKFPAVVAILDRWMERRAAGELQDLNLKALYKTIKKLHPTVPSLHSFNRHCNICRTENYEKVRERE